MKYTLKYGEAHTLKGRICSEVTYQLQRLRNVGYRVTVNEFGFVLVQRPNESQPFARIPIDRDEFGGEYVNDADIQKCIWGAAR